MNITSIRVKVLFLCCTMLLKIDAACQHVLSPWECDSLVHLENKYTREDAHELEMLNNLAYSFAWYQVDSGVFYSNKAIALAQKLNNQSQLAIAYNNKAALLNHQIKLIDEKVILEQAISIAKRINNENILASSYLLFGKIQKGSDQLKMFDDAWNLFHKTKNAEGIALANLALSDYFVAIDPDTSLTLCEKAFTYYTSKNNKTGICQAELYLSQCYLYKGDLSPCLDFANKALEIANSTNIPLLKAKSNHTMGNYYYMVSDFKNAIKNYIEALRIAELINSSSFKSGTINNIGGVYSYLKNNDKALYYLNMGKALSIANPDNLMYINLCSGNIYLEQKENLKAKKEFSEGLQTALSTNNLLRQALFCTGLAETYSNLNNYDSAMQYLNKTIVLSQNESTAINNADYHFTYAKVLKNAPDIILLKWNIDPKQKTNLIISTLKKAISLSKEVGDDLTTQVAFELSEIYAKINNPDSAFYYYKIHNQLKDSVLNTDNVNAITNLEMQYETEKKEQQIVLLSKDKEIKQTEIEGQKVQRNSMIAAFAMVAMIGGVTWNRYRLKQNSNRQLNIAHERLHNAQQQLIQLEKMASLGQIATGIAHEIQNPLNFVINFGELCTDIMDELHVEKAPEKKLQLTNELITNIHKIDHHTKRTENIVRSMMMQSQNQQMPKQVCQINEICKEAITFVQHAAASRYIDFRFHIDTNMDFHIPPINLVYQDISQVILNILNNSIFAIHKKMSLENGGYTPQIKVITKLENNCINILIEDNGIGIPTQLHAKIFQPFFTTKNTNEGTGLGLSISNDIVKAHHGEMEVESMEGEYTKVKLFIPIV